MTMIPDIKLKFGPWPAKCARVLRFLTGQPPPHRRRLASEKEKPRVRFEKIQSPQNITDRRHINTTEISDHSVRSVKYC